MSMHGTSALHPQEIAYRARPVTREVAPTLCVVRSSGELHKASPEILATSSDSYGHPEFLGQLIRFLREAHLLAPPAFLHPR